MFHNESGPGLILCRAGMTHDGNSGRERLDTFMFIMEHYGMRIIMQCTTNPYCTIMKLVLGWIVLGRAGMTPPGGNAFGE